MNSLKSKARRSRQENRVDGALAAEDGLDERFARDEPDDLDGRAPLTLEERLENWGSD